MSFEPSVHSEIFYPHPRVPIDLERAIIPVDKPRGRSSFWVIRVLRGILGVRKIGHAGTLDPMATGLLICMVGRATKLVDSYMGLPKSYTGVIRLGQTTASYDAETEILEDKEWQGVTSSQLEDARRSLTGKIVQYPPMYSAIKIEGRRLYELARKGKEVERKGREVTISRFDFMGRDGRDVSFVVDCSKGTYIRSLAHDFGQMLGVGAHLVELRRTAIGQISVEQAWDLDLLREAVRASRGEGAE